CTDCGKPLVFTLHAGLTCKPEEIEEFPLPASEKAAFSEHVRQLKKFAMEQWRRELDLQTLEDIPKILCTLRDDLQIKIEGLGTFDDLDAALFLPLSEAVKTLRTVKRRVAEPEALAPAEDQNVNPQALASNQLKKPSDHSQPDGPYEPNGLHYKGKD